MASLNQFIGTFGRVIFSVSSDAIRTFDNLSVKTASTFADHEVAGRKPVSEFTGHGLDEITFTMQLNSIIGASPLVELYQLESMKESGNAFRLIVGVKNFGKFTIRDLSHDWAHVIGGGIPVLINVTITLREYEPTLSTQAKEAQREDEVMRGTTGKGGPEKLPGSPVKTKERELTPVFDEILDDLNL